MATSQFWKRVASSDNFRSSWERRPCAVESMVLNAGSVQRGFEALWSDQGLVNPAVSVCPNFDTVKAEGSEAEARYAGRVETGRPSFGDPLMGGVV